MTRPIVPPATLAPLLLGSMAGALVAGRFETAIACVALAGIAAAAAGAPWPSAAWFRLTALGGVLAVVLNTYLATGARAPAWFPFASHASLDGLSEGALLALRLIGASLAVHGLRFAWPGERAADEGARLLRPLERVRVPVGEAHMVLGLALRFAPLLRDEARRIARIQELRAGRAARGWRESLGRYRAAAVPALVSSLERAEQVALALEARHYRVRPARALPRPPWAWTAAGWMVAGTALLWRR